MAEEKETQTKMVVRKPDAVISPIPDAKNVRLMATDLYNSRLFRGVESIPHAIAAIQCGAELGIPPVASLNQIKIIKGQLTLSARLLMALAHQKAGVTWKVVESTAKRCEIIFSRPGWEPLTSIFTIEEAQKAGLVKDDSGWMKFPEDMLFARSGSRGTRRIAPDTTSGMYTTEEIEDADIVDTTSTEEPEASTGIFPEASPVAQPKEKEQPDKKEPEKPKAQTSSPEGYPEDESIADIAAKAEAEAEGKTPEVEAAIKAIKDKLEAEGVDLTSFKEWLFSYQNKVRPVKAYIGKIGKSFRFHLGKKKDILQLAEFIDLAIKTFRTGKPK
jgi:hypothetical protein